MRLDGGIPRYASVEKAIASGRPSSAGHGVVAVREATATRGGGLKILLDEQVVAFVDVTPLSNGGSESAALWAQLIVPNATY